MPLDTATSCVADADSLYDELCPRLLSRLERVAASDTKYAERCRLENYAFIGEALRGLAATVPALQQHWQVGAASGTPQAAVPLSVIQTTVAVHKEPVFGWSNGRKLYALLTSNLVCFDSMRH